jgi:hypothetical protein
MMAYKIPTDEKLLAAVGRIAVTHGHLDHAVRMLIKSICAISLEEAMDATKRTGSAELRIRVKKPSSGSPRRLAGGGAGAGCAPG